MAAWEKVKFYYNSLLDHPGSVLTATSEASGFPVGNVKNWLEANRWKAGDATDPHYVSLDTYSDATGADYLAIMGHNLASIGASVVLQCSSDGSSWFDVAALRPTSSGVMLQEFPILINGGMDVWDDGTSSAPAGWGLSGSGATVTLSTDRPSGYSYSAQVVRNGADCMLYRLGGVPGPEYYRGKTVTLGCWVRSWNGSHALLTIGDGIGSSSQYHPGNGNWEWVSITRTIHSAATQVVLHLWVVNVNDRALFTGAVAKVCTSVSPGDAPDIIQPGSLPRRWWRLKITGHSAPPEMSICAWGNRTELDYVSAGFDPYEEEIKANVTRSDTGYVLGVHDRYRERRMTLRFEDADDELYQKIRDWWDNHGLRNFFVAWERGNRPGDVFLMMPEPRFNNPFKLTGRRDISISLTGRRE